MKNNTVKSFLAGFVVCLAILPSFAAPKFQSALPVWPEGRTTRMNDFVEFRASFEAKAGEKPILRVTGSSVYRIRLNDPSVLEADYPVELDGTMRQCAYVELGNPGIPHAVVPVAGLQDFLPIFPGVCGYVHQRFGYHCDIHRPR